MSATRVFLSVDLKGRRVSIRTESPDGYGISRRIAGPKYDEQKLGTVHEHELDRDDADAIRTCLDRVHPAGGDES